MAPETLLCYINIAQNRALSLLRDIGANPIVDENPVWGMLCLSGLCFLFAYTHFYFAIFYWLCLIEIFVEEKAGRVPNSKAKVQFTKIVYYGQKWIKNNLEEMTDMQNVLSKYLDK